MDPKTLGQIPIGTPVVDSIADSTGGKPFGKTAGTIGGKLVIYRGDFVRSVYHVPAEFVRPYQGPPVRLKIDQRRVRERYGYVSIGRREGFLPIYVGDTVIDSEGVKVGRIAGAIGTTHYIIVTGYRWLYQRWGARFYLPVSSVAGLTFNSVRLTMTRADFLADESLRDPPPLPERGSSARILPFDSHKGGESNAG